jgi:3-isopropylmalate dehydrogenase
MTNVLMLAGDGVGGELMPEVRRVIDWFVARRGLRVALHEEPFGIRSWHERGTLMSEQTWEHVLAADAILFGAIGSPEYDSIPAEHRQKDWLLEMRKSLDLYQNLRPVRAYNALLESSTLGAHGVRGVDLVIVREDAGGANIGTKTGSGELPQL